MMSAKKQVSKADYIPLTLFPHNKDFFPCELVTGIQGVRWGGNVTLGHAQPGKHPV